MSGFDNDILNCDNVDFSGDSPVEGQIDTDGQLLIGSTASPNIRPGTLASADGSVTITVGAGTIDLAAAGGGGGGNVTASSNITDNAVVRGDGGVKGVQESVIFIDDAGVATGFTQIDVDNLTLDGNTVSSTDVNGDIIFSPNGTGGAVVTTDLTVGNASQDVSFTVNGAAITATVSIEGQNASDLGGLISHRHSATAGFGGHIVALRSRGNHATPTIVADDDTLSLMASAGFDGTDYALAAQIVTQVDGTPGADDMPGRIVFLTSPDGTQVPVEAMRIDSSQVVTFANAIPVGSGGTGATTLTDGGILLGSGTSAITATSQPTNGQLLIGSTGVDPVLGTLTAPAAGITITEGAGSITFALADGLAALEALAGTGIVAHTGADTYAERTITGTADFIDVADGDGVAGNPTLSINTKFEETGMHGWNGCLLETASVTAASDGATITFSVELSGGGDLDVVFSDGYYLWDTTPADTVTLTPGTDTVPVLNYVYFLQSTKTLTASTVGFPASEHAPLATILCPSAATFQTDGPYKFHAWTDHVISSFNEGHIPDINFWIRKQPATYESGVAQTFTITTNGGAADNVILTTASGVVLQLHDQTFPAFSGTPDVYVVNDNTTPYTKVTDLNALLTDSTGASMAGKYFSLVIWGCVSENPADSKLFCNLPGGSYNSSANLIADPDKYANFDIPSDFTGTGFLIAQWNLRHQAAASGTWTSIQEIDLRGLIPSIVPGGSSAFPSEFVDTAFRIFDDGDDTKKIAFQASGITTATTRTMTVPDADGTIAYASGLADNGFAYALDGNTIDSTAAATNGQLLIGSTGVAPVAASLTAPAAGLTITGGAGSITFALADSLAALEGLTGNGVVVKTGADTFTERTITGTGSRITITNGNGVSGNPTVDISAAYVGQASITTLGTIATGTWEATDVGVAHGGTGRSSHTAYAVICGGTTGTGAQQSIASVGNSGEVLTSNGAGALPTFQANSAAFTWNDVTGTSDTFVASNGYISNNAGLVTITLPATAAVGDYFRITGLGAGGWLIAQNASQLIHLGSSVTTTGAGGSLASTNQYDSLEFVCVATNTTFNVLSSIGNITVT